MSSISFHAMYRPSCVRILLASTSTRLNPASPACVQFLTGKIDALDRSVTKRSERSVQLEMAHKVRLHKIKDPCVFEFLTHVIPLDVWQAVVGQLSLEYDLKPIPRPAERVDNGGSSDRL